MFLLLFVAMTVASPDYLPGELVLHTMSGDRAVDAADKRRMHHYVGFFSNKILPSVDPSYVQLHFSNRSEVKRVDVNSTIWELAYDGVQLHVGKFWRICDPHMDDITRTGVWIGNKDDAVVSFLSSRQRWFAPLSKISTVYAECRGLVNFYNARFRIDCGKLEARHQTELMVYGPMEFDSKSALVKFVDRATNCVPHSPQTRCIVWYKQGSPYLRITTSNTCNLEIGSYYLDL